MGAINKVWHARNVMPKNATFKERVIWHTRHAAACACRKMPASIALELARREPAKKKARSR
jgi:hypothetical protein